LARLDHIPRYDDADLKRWFYTADLARSDSYLKAVRILEISDGTINATVRGSQRTPYAVRIHFERDSHGALHLGSTCSCPVGWPCKHVAATLRVARERLLEVDTHSSVARRVNPDVQLWINELRQALRQPETAPKRPAKANSEALYYMLSPEYDDIHWSVAFAKGRVNAQGQPTGLRDWANVERALLQPPAFVRDDDLTILRLLWAGGKHHGGEFPLRGETSEEALRRMLASDRLVAAHAPHEAFRAGDTLAGDLTWIRLPHGAIAPRLVVPGESADIMALNMLWYVNPETFTVGQRSASRRLPAGAGTDPGHPGRIRRQSLPRLRPEHPPVRLCRAGLRI
jgi:hypothetical protein